MKRITIPFALAAFFSVSACTSPRITEPVYLDNDSPIEERVEDVLERMTLEEKIGLIHAQSKFSSPGVSRLGIPELWCSDGPHGIRPEVKWDEWKQAGWTNDSCTAFPALTALAATWNEKLSSLYGKSLGEEARYRKKSVLLGPGVNILRTPLNGRNFEYLGEDPYLASRLVVPYVKGIQENGVAACVKHFALNNSEVNRHNTNVNIDDRTLHEIYLPAFKAAVCEGGVWSIMGSYNMYENVHCCHNDKLLNQILKGEWGFDGVVISDWGGTHDTYQAVKHGLDLEFGTWTNGLTSGLADAYRHYYMSDAYLDGIKRGVFDTKELDEKCRRVLRLTFRTEMAPDRPYGRFTCPEHYAAARRIGGESLVLLRNEGNLLPIDVEKGHSILVVGENAIKMMSVGGGSSSLKVKREILPLDGIRSRFGKDFEIEYERGYVGDTGDLFDGVSSGQDLTEHRTAEQLVSDAVAAARKADYVLFIGGLNKSEHQDCEDADRLEYNLPYGQDELISALAEVNRKVIVVNVSGNPVAMPWIDKVPAVIQSWYLGSEAGNILADVLSGDINPSGKLPFTIPVRLEDGPIKTVRQYPGIDCGEVGNLKGKKQAIHQMDYSEGVFVGYRWYDSKGIRPLFAFGHGLSYTSFEISNIRTDKTEMKPGEDITVSMYVANTGKQAGSEVVQLYIQDNECSVDRPHKELKGFRKIFLEPGQRGEVKMQINAKDLSFFDETRHQWVAEPGTFTIHVGTASDAIIKTLEFKLNAEYAAGSRSDTVLDKLDSCKQ